MNWEQLLSTKRLAAGGGVYQSVRHNKADLRSDFEKDYHRIIGSASFRRLQDKTQVFPLDQSDFIRTRLTHSLEVSSFAKSLGQNVGENILVYKNDPKFTVQMKEDIANILQCAGLIHDIGNPPFGHYGEEIIREWFEENLSKLTYHGKPIDQVLTPQMLQDFYHFEGNAQALRLVTKLHFYKNENGMNLTCALLNTIVKYPISSCEINKESGNIKDKKMGFYYADQDIYETVARENGTMGVRHPLTYLLEAADDMAYKTADIEDAFVKGYISYNQLREELEILEKNYGYTMPDYFQPARKLVEYYEEGKEKGTEDPEEYAIKNWIVRTQSFLVNCATFGFTSNYKSIMEGTYEHDLFYHTFAEKLMDLLGELAYREVFTSRDIFRMEVMEHTILKYLLDTFMKAAIKFDDPDEKLSSIDERMITFISTNYKRAYHIYSEGRSDVEKLYLRLLLVTDYICGMTDSYAKMLYQEMKAIM